MNLRHVLSLASIGLAALLGGCDQGREAPARVGVRVANAAPSFAELRFRREQTQASALAFRSAQNFDYDADTYDFFVDERSFITAAPPRSWTFAQTMRAGFDYTFVLVENAGEVSPTVFEIARPSASSAQIAALHALGGLPAMDLYLEPPGIGIGGAAPRGTLTEGGQIAPTTLAPGEYELTLTVAGNPADVLFTSTTIALAAAETAIMVVTPEGGLGTAALSVMLLQANPALLYDRNATSEIRVINGAADGQPRDFAINGEFTPPLFSAIPFGGVTAYAAVPVASSQPINVTPAGNPGALEIDQVLTTVSGQRATIVVGGETGSLLHVVAGDDGRRIANEAKLRFATAATQFAAIDFVLVEPGVDPNLFAPDSALAVPGYSDYLPRAPGEYDLYLRQTGTTTLVSGPTRLTLAAQGIYGVLAVNGADTATANIILFDDFP
jgi:hypothetical protein